MEENNIIFKWLNEYIDEKTKNNFGGRWNYVPTTSYGYNLGLGIDSLKELSNIIKDEREEIKNTDELFEILDNENIKTIKMRNEDLDIYFESEKKKYKISKDSDIPYSVVYSYLKRKESFIGDNSPGFIYFVNLKYAKYEEFDRRQAFKINGDIIILDHQGYNIHMSQNKFKKVFKFIPELKQDYVKTVKIVVEAS